MRNPDCIAAEAEDGQYALTVTDQAGQLELIPPPAPVDTRTAEQRAADTVRETPHRYTA